MRCGGTRWHSSYILVILVLAALLPACVQPVPPTPTPGPTETPTLAPPPTQPPTPTPPAPSAAITFPAETVSNWLTGLGVPVSNLNLFIQLQASTDDMVGFTFTDSAGQLCGGYVQALETAPPQILSGDFRCIPASGGVIAFPLLFALTSTGEPYVGTFIYVNPAIAPTANAYAVEFPNNLPPLGGILSNFGTIALRPGLDFPSQAVIIDAGGNEVTRVQVQ